MRLCHFGWSHSSHVRRWVRWFAARGHESHLVTDRPDEVEGVTLHVLPSFREYDPRPRRERLKDWSFHHWRLGYLRMIKWGRDLVRELNPDVVHSHTLWHPGIFGAFVPARSYVVTVFNGDVSWRKDRKLLNLILLRYSIHKADLITSVSNNLLMSCHRLGAPKSKLHRIMRGVDLTRFRPVTDRPSLRRVLSLGSGPVVLSPRSTGKFYNLDSILMATPEIVKYFPNVQIVFIWQSASEEEVDSLNNLASSLNVGRNVRFVGKVRYEKVHLYNQAADLMVSVPSYDGLSSAILEAMSCGAVPVVSNLSTTREWVRHNRNGLLVTPRDVQGIAEAILALLSDEEQRNEIAQRNIDMMRLRGNQELWMERMESLYSSLLAEDSKERHAFSR